ncbi:MAG: DUF3792 family protein [Gammaproteobacteria bacterium]|nr:MAG: DUF3792 family protein [Gammaproteobacteria bacterium]
MVRLDIRGILAGVLAFALLYGLYALASSWLVGRGGYAPWVITLAGYLVWLLAGYVAGAVSGRAGLLNGAVTGLLTSLVMAGFLFIGLGDSPQLRETIRSGILFWMASGVLLCGLGGLLNDLHRRSS